MFNINDEEHFQFNQEECYLVFLTYLNGTECKFFKTELILIIVLVPNDLKNYPQSLIEVANSTENLSPRGLKNLFSSNIE